MYIYLTLLMSGKNWDIEKDPGLFLKTYDDLVPEIIIDSHNHALGERWKGINTLAYQLGLKPGKCFHKAVVKWLQTPINEEVDPEFKRLLKKEAEGFMKEIQTTNHNYNRSCDHEDDYDESK